MVRSDLDRGLLVVCYAYQEAVKREKNHNKETGDGDQRSFPLAMTTRPDGKFSKSQNTYAIRSMVVHDVIDASLRFHVI